MTQPIPNKEPYAFQREIANNRHNVFCADKTGVGKSGSAIAYCMARAEPYQTGMVHIITTLKGSFTQMRNEVLDFDPTAGAYVLTRNKKKWPELINYIAHAVQNKNTYIIINLETLQFEPFVKYIESIKREYLCTMVVDESHLIKNPKSNRWEALKEFFPLFRHRIVTTATPMESSVADYWTQLHFLYPDEYTAYRYFENQYTYAYGRGRRNYSFALKDIVRRMSSYYYSRTKHDVRNDMPDKIVTHVQLEAEPSYVETYRTYLRNMGKEFFVKLPDGNVVEDYVSQRMTLISRLRSLGEMFDASGKIPYIYTHYPNPTVEEPLLILTSFRRTAERIAAHYNVTPIIGGKLYKEEIYYQRVVVGTIDKLGTSKSMNHIDTAIIVSEGYSSIKRQQAEERIYRVNSMNSKEIVYLQTLLNGKTSIDHIIANVVKLKLKDVVAIQMIYDMLDVTGD